MKKNTILTAALLLLISSAYTHGQGVTLGDATFDATSDQVPANSYSAVTTDAITSYTGYGDKAGVTRTDVYHRFESVAGVKALKCRTTVTSPPPDPGAGVLKATLPALPEDRWLARDTQGNLRVLKVVSAGLVSFQASATDTPPILMPASFAAGQTWDLLGDTMTVVDVNASSGGYDNLLKVKVESPAIDPQFNYYRAGTGLVIVEQSSTPAPAGSGLKLKQP